MDKKKETKKTVKKEKSGIDKNYIIIGALILVIIACIWFTIHVIVKANKDKEPENTFNISEVLVDTTISNVEIRDSYLISGNELSTYGAVITYKGSGDYLLNSLDVIFTIDGNEVRETLLSDTTLYANQEKYISVTFGRDYCKATEVRYEVK